MRLIDADRLCEDLLNRWSIADTRKEELIRQVMADVVTPIVVSQPTIEPQKWIPCSERSPQKSGNYMYNNTENYGGPILTPDERAIIMNAINDMLEEKHINLDAIGYEDLDGMFSVYFMKKDKDKPVKAREEKFCPAFYEES